jgi:hypothetical protein
MNAADGGNLQIIRTYDLPRDFELMAYYAICRGRSIVERKRSKRAKRLYNRRNSAVSAAVFLGAMK